jgi:hypothetical protein
MERTLYTQNGEAVAYILDDYHETIYLWSGLPVAYLHDEQHVYGINGRHLGRFINDIIYNNNGERIGFTSSTCPVSIAKEQTKPKRYPMDEIRPRWAAPSLPNLSFNFADQDLVDLLTEGQVARFVEEESSEEIQD